ncbi:Crp/Fnr family transcriptional regulator [Pseudohoeflea suaedae]|uniref:Crp/Fnr family transcriptional regulator n=1 Tax=Pseudohoeflea suaedae TaxID=877384 RepID=A0A4R5PMX4_9HYPH|nr:Crp/Fnr family transcriptional regulator [Pseudohoeflea suaedae]TDH38346.1 Crp/Fnr family transcriptional regulator [Pseudohoeflea suaedae]
MDKDKKRVSCSECPLRSLPAFRDFSDKELAFVSDFKTGELVADPGATILVEGAHSAHLYTVLSGWAFRYKTLADGRRQILNFVMPGDLVGLQGTLMDEMQHSIEALTPVRLCVFERGRISKVYTQHPTLAFDITWMAAREERILDENLLSVGRRSAFERAAYLLVYLYQRAKLAGLLTGRSAEIPVTQQHVADTLGLSTVHTNKTLRKLADRNLIKWRERACDILDEEGLLTVSSWEGFEESSRPFI